MEPLEDARYAEFIDSGLRHVDINRVLAWTNISVSTLRALRSAGVTDAFTLRGAVASGLLPPGLPAEQADTLRVWVREVEAGLAEEFATLADPKGAQAGVLNALAGADRAAAERLLPLLATAEVREVVAVRLRLYPHGEAHYDSAARFSALYLHLCEVAEAGSPGLFGPAMVRGNITALAVSRVRRGLHAEPRKPGWPAPDVLSTLRDVRDRAAVYKPGAWHSPPLPLLALATRVLLSSPEVRLPEECRRAWAGVLTEFGIHVC